MSRPASVHDLVQSHRITAVIYAAAKLNLAETIGDEAKSVAESPGWYLLTKARCADCSLA